MGKSPADESRGQTTDVAMMHEMRPIGGPWASGVIQLFCLALLRAFLIPYCRQALPQHK